MTPQAVQSIRDQLHLSHSQLFTYLNCSLKYKYQYVEARPAERISIALPFGKSIHRSIEHYYKSLKDGTPVQLGMLETIFAESIHRSAEAGNIPLLFKKETPDVNSAIAMGKKMLKAFYEGTVIGDYEVVDVELPLSAPLYDIDGQPLDMQLIGYIDLLLKDKQGNILVVDQKTAKQKKTQSAVDSDLQMTAYSYLLAANKYVFPRAEVQCRFDVLRKLKTPKLELYHTTRGPEQRKKFCKLATAVLAGIDNRVFIPCKSWLCSDCQYAQACREEW